MPDKTTIQQYLCKHKNLTPLYGDNNIPSKGWQNKTFDRQSIISHNGSVAWVLSHDDLIIDVDPRNGGTESYKKLKSYLGESLDPTVLTPRGGFHVYMSIPERHFGKKLKKTLEAEYKGIDFLTKGSLCTTCGSSKVEGKYKWAFDLLQFIQTDAPDKLIELLLYEHKAVDTLADNAYKDCPESKIIDALNKISPSLPNDGWIKVGMALHNWSPTRGLKLFEDWSRKGTNYIEGDTEKRWKSFTSGNTTLGTIFHMAKQDDFDNETFRIQDYMRQISIANEKDINLDILPKIKKSKISDINREKIAKAVKDRLKVLSGVIIPIGKVRTMVKNYSNDTRHTSPDAPEWCKHYAYVNTHEGFIDMRSRTIYKPGGFNVCNGKHVPWSDDETKPSATKYVSDRGYIEVFDTKAYMPANKNATCMMDGKSVVNSFNPNSVPKEAEEYTDEGSDAIQIIMAHIKFICTENEICTILLQWLAHQVQHPGIQILWSPIIQSIQGVGKTFFSELLRGCLGNMNVGTVSPDQVVSQYNGWAIDKVVNILEELRVRGHNRYDSVNSLKPVITDSIIFINDKFVKPYITYNTTNYICFTNHKDSLPLESDDRRWFVIFVPIQKLSELRKYVGEDAGTYFPKLYKAVREHGPEIRKWLLEVELTDEFLNMKQAPNTNHKRSMIATEEESFEGLSETREMIQQGGDFFNEHVISCPDLFNDMRLEYPELDIQNKMRPVLLKKLGYMLLEQIIKLDGKTRKIWSKKQYSNAEIRELFKNPCAEVTKAQRG
jgi:hypothetical protein